jgi:segregation and condensation protein A
VATFQEVNRDKDVLNYVSLLFMAQRKTVWLEQEVFFGELFIKRHPQNRPVIG